MGMRKVKPYVDEDEKKKKREKFDFEEMKIAATDKDPLVRKKTFIEYFERFAEFPSYLFDNERQMDPQLRETIDEILKDKETSSQVRAGVASLLLRLPS